MARPCRFSSIPHRYRRTSRSGSQIWNAGDVSSRWKHRRQSTDTPSRADYRRSRRILPYHEALTQNGFDPAARSVTLMLHTYLGPNRETVKERIRIPFREYLRSSLGLVERLIASLALPVILGV